MQWDGFRDPEAANGHIQCLEELFLLGTDFQYELLRCERLSGLVLHVQVNKTQSVTKASNRIAYVRRGAASQPCDSPELIKRLEYAKGVSSFETEIVNVSKELIAQSDVINAFIRDVVPTAQPESWPRKQVLLRQDRPTVEGVLLFVRIAKRE